MMHADDFRFKLNQERRVTEQLLLYWNGLRRQRKFPAREDLNPEALRNWWDECFLAVAGSAGNTALWRLEHAGTSFRLLCGSVPEDAQPFEDYLVPLYRQVMREGKPMVEESGFPDKNGMDLRYRLALLPLGPDESTVSHALGCVGFRAYAPGGAVAER